MYTVSTYNNITAYPQIAEANTLIELAVTPPAGHQLKAGTLGYGVVLGGLNDPIFFSPIDETTRKFILPAHDVTVTAEFEPIPPYTLALNQPVTPTDLKLRFGFTATDAEGVSAVFTAVHNLITTPIGNDSFATIIKLGDWIDLPSLHVAGYPVDDIDIDGGGRYGKIDIDSNTTLAGNHGALLRLIVVGINSFAEITNVGNDTDNAYNQATPHVVFQFQNLPGTHRMEATDTSQNGYLGSEMRKYLAPVDATHPLGVGGGNFLTGLINAGVPDAVLWAPSRRVTNKGSGAYTADTIADKLWLPTDWEMFGSNHNANATYENSTNQASFAGFYNGNGARKKYNASNSAGNYWLASPYSNFTSFCFVGNDGADYHGSANFVGGVAPVFCVR
jgi:hypothetical protein